MKESFSELYARLYTENFRELEVKRKKEKYSRIFAILIFITLGILAFINIALIIVVFIVYVIYILNIKEISIDTKLQNEKSYKELFKEKIVGPIIENFFENAKYDPLSGISANDYKKAGYIEPFDRIHSEDLIIAPLNVNGETKTFMTISEVNAEKVSRDSDGDITYTTVFYGLAGNFLLPKNISKNIYIRSDGEINNSGRNKVKLDMSRFEKIFDVESDDQILAVRILTADVMTEMVELYEKYKYGFEINILKDTVYMRLKTGPMFEPEIFRSSMEYKQIEKYYLVLRALESIASHIYDTILKLEL